MKIVTCLLALTVVASVDPVKPTTTDLVCWESFPGPTAAPAVTPGVAAAMCCTCSSPWRDRL